MFSTINEILSTLKFGTLSQTSGALLISNGRIVHVEFLFDGHVDGPVCVETSSRLERINSTSKKETVGKQFLEVIDAQNMNVYEKVRVYLNAFVSVDTFTLRNRTIEERERESISVLPDLSFSTMIDVSSPKVSSDELYLSLFIVYMIE